MNYSTIMADPVIGRTIGQLYMDASPVITAETRSAYRDFAFQVEQQYRAMTEHLEVIFQERDPYQSHREMFADVELGILRIYETTEDQRHPLLSMIQNDRFRAVHDYYGHYSTGRGFDRHGEEAAWVRHSGMFYGPARRAMTTETRGQNSAFIWLNGGKEFPPQKAVLLPEWVSETGMYGV